MIENSSGSFYLLFHFRVTFLRRFLFISTFVFDVFRMSSGIPQGRSLGPQVFSHKTQSNKEINTLVESQPDVLLKPRFLYFVNKEKGLQRHCAN